ncbi:helix-turn-helix transcriptional regulator [Marinicella gelatinilytica]|uniref:helix-turn-helix transcriptional regulator n=1 Tax=Marinicella gelatinilytica TaxID=2996017 RepID=UPI002260FBEE|nr:WYL domain-containing protein [Marinicella gelatinilytica]MCX7545762.1 WYL domain-containing protein [Marinicella gelatinilytica]
MKRLEQLDQILQDRRSPITVEQLMDRLNCSKATVYRRINELKTHYQAPILQDDEHRFYYDKKANFALPGIRFTAEEAQGLLMAADILNKLHGDNLAAPIARITNGIADLLAEQGITNQKLIQFIPTLVRKASPQIFLTVLTALQQQKKLNMTYRSRQGLTSQRLVSPQHLTYYKNNWYLDAWCHKKEGLRLFAVELIEQAQVDIERSQQHDKDELRQHYANSYGLFAGKATEHAKIRIDLQQAPWVENQIWHSGQKIVEQKGHHLVIEIPYQHDAELLADIRQLGEAAEILAPVSLRQTMQQDLRNTLAHYNQPAS